MMIIVFLQEVHQYQMMNLVLIIMWVYHLQNQWGDLMGHINFSIKLSLPPDNSPNISPEEDKPPNTYSVVGITP